MEKNNSVVRVEKLINELEDILNRFETEEEKVNPFDRTIEGIKSVLPGRGRETRTRRSRVSGRRYNPNTR